MWKTQITFAKIWNIPKQSSVKVLLPWCHEVKVNNSKDRLCTVARASGSSADADPQWRIHKGLHGLAVDPILVQVFVYIAVVTGIAATFLVYFYDNHNVKLLHLQCWLQNNNNNNNNNNLLQTLSCCWTKKDCPECKSVYMQCWP